MAHAPSTEKPSKALKNLFGTNLEKKISQEFHQEGIPLLVSPLVLRSRKLGQIDLSRLVKKKEAWRIEVVEVKSSFVGAVQMGRYQKFRLSSAQKFLSSVFGYPSSLVTLMGKEDEY